VETNLQDIACRVVQFERGVATPFSHFLKDGATQTQFDFVNCIVAIFAKLQSENNVGARVQEQNSKMGRAL
jgi:hypothetical protein